MLFIGTPLYENKVCTQYMHGMMQTMSLLQSRGLSMQYAMEQGTYIGLNREHLVRTFLKTNCQFFLFIDADTAFTPTDVLALLAADVDVVSAFYRFRKAVPEGRLNHCFQDLDKRPIELTAEGPVELKECYFLPTGMLMIRRSVFEKLYLTHKYLFNQGFLLPEGDEGTEWQRVTSAYEGEDCHFSRLWRQAGGKLFVKPDIRVGHIGEHCYIPRNNPR